MSLQSTSPKTVSVEEHSPAYLHCSITPNSNNIVAWTRLKDQTLLTAGAKSFTTDGRFQISPRSDNDWVLIIRRTEVSDTGCYFCEVNTEPNRIIEPVFLEVRQRKSTLSVGIEGNDIILNCTITGLPVEDDEVMWSKNDMPMDLTQIDKYTVLQQIHPSSMSHILRIYEGNKNDEGIYSCSGNNLPTAQHRMFHYRTFLFFTILILIHSNEAIIGEFLMTPDVVPSRRYDTCENLSESALYGFTNERKNIKLIITKDSQCYLECEIMSSPKPKVNWYKNQRLYESQLDKMLDHTDDIINSKNVKSQLSLSNIISRIQIYSENAGDEFNCEIINPCLKDSKVSNFFIVPNAVSSSCSKTSKTKRFITAPLSRSIFKMPRFLGSSKSKYIKPPVITTSTAMRMEYPGNFITLSCQSEAQPQAINKWEMLEGDDEKGNGISVEKFNFVKILDNGDLFVNSTNLSEDVAELTFRCNATNKYGWDSAVSTILFVNEE
uniref:Ig-like domain-containing protein n=1 Tax=Parastrongyloides trichosuri TaxID=131310 RepID=A0A0N4ZKI5_PARTI